MIPWLPAGSDFPEPEYALDEPNGLLAAGNDLAPATLLRAYRRGIFPWYDPSQPILWWSPNPRCVFRPGDLHISRRLRRHLNRAPLTFTLDRHFETVIDACAAPRDDDGGTWISAAMRAAYVRLHGLGYAHCLAVHEDGELAGGIYGVQLGGVFYGESMFSTRTDGSKSALAALWALAPRLGIGLLDAQVENPHLMRLGASLMPRADFQRRLDELITDTTPLPWPGGPYRWSALDQAH
ncbi:leucyl/phenylalanyl-tRNA--protein transferase [Alloalcanivorax mobilis]|uniref:leucyl/phenylalanyl-tRNA--protein transferase n=1 Tax=Alloalcanivorax mobilis TaxID=2019569 RepID=UPI000C78070A|nr:leucyl/phenylalanyl-tRNA--protein transferase [Alloalcanivorax mobilis]